MKISNLPKATRSTNGDLITIVQGNTTKVISVKDFTASLSQKNTSLSNEIKNLRSEMLKKSLDKTNPVLTKNLKIPSPLSPRDAATKEYVDNANIHNIRVDGSNKLIAPLSYNTTFSFSNKDVVTKEYADKLLDSTMKTVKHLTSNSFPRANAGDVFISMAEYSSFAGGAALQKGDILICIDKSEGGTSGEVASQFAIVNTNVITSSEVAEGIIRIATDQEVRDYSSNTSAITPTKLKDSFNSSSMFNRSLIEASLYDVAELDRGILAVDNRKSDCTITLPSVATLVNANMFKLTIKDEFGSADLKNITIKALGSTIDAKSSIVLTNKYQAVTIYNDGKDYYIENNTHSGASSSGGSAAGESSSIIQSGTIQPSAVDTDITMYAASVDLSDYDVNQGFVVEVSGFFADNTNNKDVAIHIGKNVTVSTATTAAPQNDAFTARVTVIKAYKYAIAYGYVLLEGIAADTYRNNLLDLDWTSTIKVSAVANTATAVSNIKIDSMIVTPLK